MKKLYTLALALLTLNALAQKNPEASKKDQDRKIHFSASLQPLFFYNNALRSDFELQQRDKLSALVVGLEIYRGRPILYTEPKEVESDFDDRVNGLGINLAYKIKLSKKEALSSPYFSPGVTFRSFDLTLEGKDFYTFQEEGIEYYTYGDTEKEYKIKSQLIYGLFGYQKVWDSSILLDFYMGVGYKISTKNAEVEEKREFETASFGYNYNGVAGLIGIKIGYQIK